MRLWGPLREHPNTPGAGTWFAWIVRAVRIVPLLLLVLGGCAASAAGTDGGGVTSHGDRDTYDPSCHWDCFGGYRCVDGVIHRIAYSPIPCWEWTGECPHVPAGVSCALGCRDGATDYRSSHLEDAGPGLCLDVIARRAGDPCRPDIADDCALAEPVADGFGGTSVPTLTCDAGSATCVATPVEVCNGVDDDGDGTTDEACARVPRLVTSAACPELRDAVITSAGAALLVSASTSGAQLVGIAPDGSARFAPVDFAGTERALEASPGGVVLVRTGAITTVSDLGVVTQLAIDRSVAVAGTGHVVPFGADWVVLDGHGHAELFASSDGHLVATGAGPGRAVAAGTDVFVFEDAGTFVFVHLLEYIDAPPQLYSAIAGDGGAYGGLGRAAFDDARILFPALDGTTREPALVSFGRSGARWTSLMPLVAPATHTAVALDADAGAIALTWFDGAVLRTRLLDAHLAELGRTELVLPVPPTDLWMGPTPSGFRVVVAMPGEYALVAPLELP